MPGEDAHVADCLADAVAAILFDKEAPQPFRREIIHEGFAVETGASFFQQWLVEICSKNLQRDIAVCLAGNLQVGHGKRVSLLSSRAAQYPDTA